MAPGRPLNISRLNDHRKPRKPNAWMKTLSCNTDLGGDASCLPAGTLRFIPSVAWASALAAAVDTVQHESRLRDRHMVCARGGRRHERHVNGIGRIQWSVTSQRDVLRWSRDALPVTRNTAVQFSAWCAKARSPKRPRSCYSHTALWGRGEQEEPSRCSLPSTVWPPSRCRFYDPDVDTLSGRQYTTLLTKDSEDLGLSRICPPRQFAHM